MPCPSSGSESVERIHFLFSVYPRQTIVPKPRGIGVSVFDLRFRLARYRTRQNGPDRNGAENIGVFYGGTWHGTARRLYGNSAATLKGWASVGVCGGGGRHRRRVVCVIGGVLTLRRLMTGRP